jgi:hypothetical protein
VFGGGVKMMEFFETLPEELRNKAWEQKKEDLADAWFDSYVCEAGDEIPNYAEEQLLQILSSLTEEDYLQKAKDFYERLDEDES